jgi:hypothetical protein
MIMKRKQFFIVAAVFVFCGLGSVQNTKTACGFFVVRPLAASVAPAAAVPMVH